MKLHIYLDHEERVLSIVIPGDLVSTAVKEINTEIETALAVPPGKAAAWQSISLNLIAAKMVDSMGLNLIVSIFKTAQKAGAKMQVIYSDPNVHRTFVFTRLDQHVTLLKA